MADGTDKIVRIGCASGFWGDSAQAAPQLVRMARLDYLVFDYLAEVTMAIMARARGRSPDLGYATDFVTSVIAEILPDLVSRGIRVIANAGGVNPLACRAALADLAAKSGIELRIAAVLGDDVMPRLDELRRCGIGRGSSGEPLPEALLSANAYLGAAPIAGALDQGADVVLTGRCVDSALVLGPLMHEFGWSADDYDRLAAGSLAGHLVECGAQATGGLFTDWRSVEDWERIGYPVIECRSDGGFVLTKPPGTGGLVTPASVAEQLVYEIGDPAAYLLPDVTCDFTEVTLRQAGPDRVEAEGAHGAPPPSDYKVCATWLDGYRLSHMLTVIGEDAAAKARRTGEALLARARTMLAARNLPDFRECLIEVLGAEDAYGPHARARTAREVVLRLSAWHEERRALELLAGEAAAPVTSMAPGTTGYLGGRPKVQAVVRLHSFFLDRREVTAEIDLAGERRRLPAGPSAPIAAAPRPMAAAAPAAGPAAPASANEPALLVRLIALAHGRSGDKGDSANIGIIARRPDYYPILRAALTEQAVADWFAYLPVARVRRYELPGISALNFLLEGALGHGATASLRNDAQGKGLAQVLLGMAVPVPESLARRDGLPEAD